VLARLEAMLCSVPDLSRSVAARPVDEMQEGLSRLAPADVLGKDARGRGRARVGGDVRGHRDPGMRPERVVLWQGFHPENVQRRMADVTVVQRCQQCGIVDELPAPASSAGE
jgi:hypothetical protein